MMDAKSSAKGDSGFIPFPAPPARARYDVSRFQEAGEICPVTPEQEQREGRDDRRKLPAFVIHEDVEAEDVHNHRAKQREPERNVTANQEDQSAGDLATG